MASGFGQMLAAFGALPTARPGQDPENLTAGMLVVVPALLLAGIVLLVGARHLPREMALMLAQKLKARPQGSRAVKACSDRRTIQWKERGAFLTP